VADSDLSRRGVEQGAPPWLPPDKPELPNDLARRPVLKEWVEGNAQKFRLYGATYISERQASRATLLAILTPVQYAQLYHYGFAEQQGKSGTLYRVHWNRGNNVSVFPRGETHAQMGLCCFVCTESHDDTIISNILALRTDEAEYRRKACSEPPFEVKFDEYYYHDAKRPRPRLFRW
jgi:hypothetical protein